MISTVMRVSLPLALALLLLVPAAPPHASAQLRPNIILVMTDGQGYGDIAARGHPVLRTPHMDRLREESVRLENFHYVDVSYAG